MGYLQGVSEQLKVFLYSFGLGFLLGVLYDIFRIIRMIFSFGKITTFIQDFLYVLLCAFVSFSFALVLNEGKVMFYLFLGEFAGFIIYYFSFGSLVMSVSRAIINAVRRIGAAVARAVSRPVMFAIKKMKKLAAFISAKSRIKSKKISKNAKFLLKKSEGMLYTLNRIICSDERKAQRSKRKRKDADSKGKKEKNI